MKRWGLRWIFCWLSVFITAACGQFSSPTPTRDTTNEGRPTLQNFIPPSTASPHPPIRPIYTLTPPNNPSIMRLATVEAGRDMMLEQPACFETPVQSLMCIGWLQNTQPFPISNTIINFYLLNSQGLPISTTQLYPVFSYLPAGFGSPYRAIFEKIPDTSWSPYAEIIDFSIESNSTQAIETLRIADFSAIWRETNYHVQGTVVDSNRVQTQARVVVSIRGEDERITGFRIIDIELVDGKGTFSIDVVPLDHQEGKVSVSADIIR